MTAELPEGIRYCEKHDRYGACHACGREGGGVARPAVAGTASLGPTDPQVTAPPSPRPKKKRAGQQHEDALQAALEASGELVDTFPPWLASVVREGAVDGWWVREFPIGLTLNPPRKFRSDFALPCKRLAVEIDGGAHAAGRKKQKTDTERRGLIVAAGWRVLTVTPAQVKDGTALSLVRQAIGGE